MINIAQLLKDAPKDLKLYSPICGHCKLSCILYDDGIRVIAHDVSFRFDKYGRFCSADDAECLLFPGEDCRTWEGWKLPVEPTFKVGDWVVFNNNRNSIYQIGEIRDSYYKLTHTHGGSIPLPFSQGNFIRPWSIEDAKDGDVLATDNGWTCIFKAFDGYGFSSYCFMDSQKWFCEVGAEGHTLDSRINGNIHPATKEQRNMFFAKMKESGYEWDADKKELRKI